MADYPPGPPPCPEWPCCGRPVTMAHADACPARGAPDDDLPASHPYTDPRLSDEATGLPPLDEVDGANAMLVLAWVTSDGLASLAREGEPVRYLSARGLTQAADGAVEWAQAHLAVPTAVAMDVAADLGAGADLPAPTERRRIAELRRALAAISGRGACHECGADVVADMALAADAALARGEEPDGSAPGGSDGS